MPAPEISSIGNAPEGYTFVKQGAPGAIATKYGGHTFYLAPVKAAATASAGPPPLSSIQAKLTESQWQNVANQLRSGENTVSVAGKQYVVHNQPWARSIMAKYPGEAPATITAPPAPQYGTTTDFPEQTALKQMAQIDPATEAARQALAKGYADPAAAMKSYLDMYQSVDPTGLALRKQLEGQIGSDLAAGSQLDPQTAREVEQGVRMAQGARGNVYGTPQMVEEAMSRGQAGLALRQKRQQIAQSYLGAGLDPATTALNLMRGQQGATQSYLASGQTPYAAGAGYLANVQQQAGAAAQGGPQYQPSALSSPYSYFNPNYGQSMGSQANQWYNSLLSSYAMQQAGAGGKSPLMGAASGALGGAVAGTAAMPGWGTLIGAGVGALGGALTQ
jgi:hypothetical protein